MEAIPEHLRYLAVEGVIGVGKTSLAKKLTAALGGSLFLEEFEENPFLEDFYVEPERYAFQTQLFFLLSRFRQQEKLFQYDLFKSPVIADYMFQKDRIFATHTLNGKELNLYDMLARILEKRVARPDLAIYLRTRTDRLMENINRRGRSYEKNIQSEYLTALGRLYDEYFWNYDASPLIIFNVENVDFVNNEAHWQQILTEICRHRSGRKNVNFDF